MGFDYEGVNFDEMVKTGKTPKFDYHHKPVNGELASFEKSWSFLLPTALKEMIDQKGGSSCRYYAHDPIHFSTIIESSLQKSIKEQSISRYVSSIHKKESVVPPLIYYAILYVEYPGREIMGVDLATYLT